MGFELEGGCISHAGSGDGDHIRKRWKEGEERDLKDRRHV